MEKFVIKSTSNIPEINFDPDTGDFRMKGRLISLTDEEYNHFQSLLAWATEYAKKPADQTVFNIHLEFCSSGGIKFIYQVFKILETMHQKNHQVSIYWHFESDDEDSGEKGYHFQKLLSLPFHVVLND